MIKEFGFPIFYLGFGGFASGETEGQYCGQRGMVQEATERWVADSPYSWGNWTLTV